MATLFGPFAEILTLEGLPLFGPIAECTLSAIEQAGLLVMGGIIQKVGPYKELRELPHSSKVLIDEPAVLLPGFIDAHTHLCFAGSRHADYARRLAGKSYREIAAEGGGIMDTVRATRAASREVLTSSLLDRLRQQMRCGITTCEVKSGYGLSAMEEMKLLQAIHQAISRSPISVIPTCLAAHLVPPEQSSPREYLSYLLRELLPNIKQLTQRIDIFIEEGAFAPQESLEFLHAAKAMGFSLTCHANQFSRGGALVAAEVGAASADHLEVISEEECSALSKAAVTATVLPGASLGLGMEMAKGRMMLDLGLSLAIASDWNPGSAPMGNVLLQAAVFGMREKLTMAETLAAITFRAARALSLTDRGRLLPGMRADCAIFPCRDHREILYHQGSLLPTQLLVDGKMMRLRE